MLPWLNPVMEWYRTYVEESRNIMCVGTKSELYRATAESFISTCFEWRSTEEHRVGGPDPHQSEKQDPDLHQSDADPQQCFDSLLRFI